MTWVWSDSRNEDPDTCLMWTEWDCKKDEGVGVAKPIRSGSAKMRNNVLSPCTLVSIPKCSRVSKRSCITSVGSVYLRMQMARAIETPCVLWQWMNLNI